MGAGIIISDTTPDTTNRYTWLKPLPDGGIELYELVEGVWTLVHSIPAYAIVAHTHSEIGDVNFTEDVYAGGQKGISGSKTIGGYQITFSKGLLTGFEPV